MAQRFAQRLGGEGVESVQRLEHRPWVQWYELSEVSNKDLSIIARRIIQPYCLFGEVSLTRSWRMFATAIPYHARWIIVKLAPKCHRAEISLACRFVFSALRVMKRIDLT